MELETRRPTARGRYLLATMAVSLSAVPVHGQELPDTSSWECKYCLFEKGYSGHAEVGIGLVSDDVGKFGEYNGLNGDGAHAIVNGTARYFGAHAYYMELRASDLGLDTRSLRYEGGRQGLYTLSLGYDELPHVLSDSAMTPFDGAGSGALTLPLGWVRAGTTAGLTALGASLRPVDLETERRRADLGLRLLPGSKWVFDVDYRHEVKEGMRGSSGSFFINPVHLVEPIDYETDTLDVSVAYNDKRWQAQLGYHLSTFGNGHQALTWDNPYLPLVAGADSGRRALPPDNRFHQLLASAGFQVNDWVRVNGNIAIGRMEQDEGFLPATSNGSLAPGALPRASLDGKVETVNAHLKVLAAPTAKLRLNASLNYDDRDNRTPQAAYSWVTTDLFVNPSRTNLPYSFTRRQVALGGDYRLPRGAKLSGGYRYDQRDRTYQEVDETTEQTVWGKVVTRVSDKVHVTAELAHAERDADTQVAVAEITPPQNPLMSKYNLADRTRNSAALHAQVMLTETVSLGLGLDVSDDDYADSKLGLTESREWTLNADASAMLSEQTTLYLYFSHQKIDSEQRGSASFGAANWVVDNDDTVDTAGLGIKHRLANKKIDLGADLVVSRSTGEMNYRTHSKQYPDLETRMTRLKLYADYRVREKVTLRAAFWHESYDIDDWSRDGVTVTTLPTGITFGETSQDHDVNVFLVSLRYGF